LGEQLAPGRGLGRHDHAEGLGVVTFYSDFRMTPPASHELKLCRAEACQPMGGNFVDDNRFGDRRTRRLGLACEDERPKRLLAGFESLAVRIGIDALRHGM